MPKQRYAAVYAFLRSEGIGIPSWIDERLSLRFEGLSEAEITESLELLRPLLPEIRANHQPKYPLAGSIFPKFVGDHPIDRIVTGLRIGSRLQTERTEQEARVRLLMRPEQIDLQRIHDLIRGEARKHGQRGGSSEAAGHLIYKLGNQAIPDGVHSSFIERCTRWHSQACLYCVAERGFINDIERRWFNWIEPEDINHLRSLGGFDTEGDLTLLRPITKTQRKHAVKDRVMKSLMDMG